jgi:hypothetical protein
MDGIFIFQSILHDIHGAIFKEWFIMKIGNGIVNDGMLIETGVCFFEGSMVKRSAHSGFNKRIVYVDVAGFTGLHAYITNTISQVEVIAVIYRDTCFSVTESKKKGDKRKE